MDIVVGPERSNLEAVYQALLQFGAPLEDMGKERFLEPDTFFRIGVPPCQIDVFPGIPGVEFEPALAAAFPDRCR